MTFQLLVPEAVVGLFSVFETQLPGWWYSLSQTSEEITVSFGPSLSSPDGFSRSLACSELGDKGFIYKFLTHQVPVCNYDQNLVEIIQETLLKIYKGGGEGYLKIPDMKDPPPRSLKAREHSEGDLKALGMVYREFRDNFAQYEEKLISVHEVYLGSCHHSADCSLRGVDLYGQPFDISHDYIDEAKMGHALLKAIEELHETFGI